MEAASRWVYEVPTYIAMGSKSAVDENAEFMSKLLEDEINRQLLLVS